MRSAPVAPHRGVAAKASAALFKEKQQTLKGRFKKKNQLSADE